MHRGGTRIDSREDLQTMSNAYAYSNTTSDHQASEQTKTTTYYETDHSAVASRRPSSPSIIPTPNSNERAKSVEHSRTLLNETMPMAPSSSSTSTSTSNNPATTITSRSSRAANVRSDGTVGTRSSTMYIDELHTTQQEGEKRELNTLNHRFGNYLDKIKTLVTVNANLRRQVDNAYRKYIGHTEEEPSTYINQKNNKDLIKKYQHPCEIKLNHLRQQINEEVRGQALLQIRLQRADFDIKFYQNNIKLLTSHDQKQSEQIRMMQQQLESNVQELEHLQRQYQRQDQDLNTYKSQYNEYINKLVDFSNEYDTIAYQRMENENLLYTLREQISFEEEFHQRRQQEFEYLEKFHYDLNQQFNQNEFHHIVKQIRQDYQEFNTIQLGELETLYQTKLETIQTEFSKRQEQPEFVKPHEVHTALVSTKKEHRTLIEENQLLKDKLGQLQDDLHKIIEQNRQRYELADREYKQLQNQIPELDCVIVHLRESAVSLWSEINTYRYLLVNLLSPNNDQSPQVISSSAVPITKPLPIEKQTITEESKKMIIQESKTTKAVINKVTTTTTTATVGTKAKSYPRQYRDETTGFVVHIEDGIIWVRI